MNFDCLYVLIIDLKDEKLSLLLLGCFYHWQMLQDTAPPPPNHPPKCNLGLVMVILLTLSTGDIHLQSGRFARRKAPTFCNVLLFTFFSHFLFLNECNQVYESHPYDAKGNKLVLKMFSLFCFTDSGYVQLSISF